MGPNGSADGGKRLRVAIIGGGITGVTLALGLQKRGVDFTLYERASAFKEIGAGIGFSPNAERSLELLDPRLHACYKAVAMPNASDYFQWVDGHATDQVIYQLYLGHQGFQGCRRSDFVDEVAKEIPAENIKFGKQIDSATEEADGRVSMRFKDGTVESADVVVGCDGIHSRVRQILLGKDNPASYPSYSHKVSFRDLVPMEQALAKLGEERTSTRFMYNGPNSHIITYPVAQGTVLNILLVISDPNPWETEDGRHTAPGNKSEAIRAVADWHPTARKIVELLPDDLNKWAIFDMLDHPAPHYARGSICVAGDAAHAVGPHLGAGAGFGMEDSLVLATLIEAVDKDQQHPKAHLCREALAVFNELRYERTQWLVGVTREACELFQWRHEAAGSDPAKFADEITWRFHKIWKYDVEGMAPAALEGLKGKMAGKA